MTAALGIAGYFLPCSVATASPEPLTDEQMFEKAALVVEAHVTAVECTGTTGVPNESDSEFYRSTSSVTNTLKGDSSDVIYIDFAVVEWRGGSIARCCCLASSRAPVLTARKSGARSAPSTPRWNRHHGIVTSAGDI